SKKSRLLCATEAKHNHQIMFLLYDALWEKGKQAWTEISHTVKAHVPDPLVAPGKTQECDLEEAQVTIVDLTSLLSWTTMDVKLDLLTPIVLAQGEYSKLDNFLESSSDHVLLVGQPGIGKTIYLTYCLLRRLIAGLPTIFAIQKRNCYVFLDSGVYWIPYDSFNMCEDPPFTNPVENTLVLFDLNEVQPTPEQFQHWRILALSSPQSGRYKEWTKHQGAKTWVMRSWPWEEIYFTLETATNKSSLKELFEAFTKYGGTARNLLNKSSEQVEEEISVAIDKCTNFRSLFLISTDLQEKTSHILITIDP
ncbi:hypothetical protein K443DRAFT_59464, partial [Laccaria amethystina LaAM-08-1]